MSEAKEAEWNDVLASPEVEDQPDPSGQGVIKEKLRVTVVGDNYLSRACTAAFDPRSVDVRSIVNCDEFDTIVEWRPNLVFLCNDIPFLKNDSLDDADLVNTIGKIAHQTEAGICIKSTINLETIERIFGAVGPEWFNAKVIYSPEFGETEIEVLSQEVALVGGQDKAMEAFSSIIAHTTHFQAKKVITGTVFEVAYAKLGIVGFKAVKQTYFNQLHQTMVDVEGANPMIVRRMMLEHPSLYDQSLLIPAFVKAQTEEGMTIKKARSYSGEYSNRDVKMLTSMTDRLTILDECINLRNLKD